MPEIDCSREASNDEIIVDLPAAPDDGDTVRLGHRYPSKQDRETGAILYGTADLDASLDTREVNKYNDFQVTNHRFESTAASKTELTHVRIIGLSDGEAVVALPLSSNIDDTRRYDDSVWIGHVDGHPGLLVAKDYTDNGTHRSTTTYKLRVLREFVDGYDHVVILRWYEMQGASRGNNSQHVVENLRATRLEAADD